MTPHEIGASDVPAILGLSPWQTPAAAWARLSGLDQRDSSSNATRRGHLLERAILWEYADRHGVPYKHEPRDLADVKAHAFEGLYQGPEYGTEHRDRHAAEAWATCRPDAYHVVADGFKARVLRLVEVKTCRSWSDWDAEDGKPILPPAYFAQVQWQMLVTGVEETIVEAFCVMDDSRRTITVKAAPKIQAQLLEKVGAWRQRHLVDGIMPEEGITAEIAGLIWPRHREPDVWLEPADEARALCEAYREAGEAEKAAKAAKDAARDALCVMIQDATGFDGLCSWRASKAGKRSFRLKGET
jgi:hypothetical protein